MQSLKNVFLKVLAISGLLAGAVVAHATTVAYTGTFQGSEGPAIGVGVTTAKTYTRDVNTTGDRISFQVSASTYSLAVSSTFAANNYVLATPTITIVGNKFTTGMQVLLSSGAVPQISGLNLGTTYYVSVINPNGTTGVSSTFKLCLVSTDAVAGRGLPLNSSSTLSNQYTLSPLAPTGYSTFQLQWSDDNVTFFNATTGNYASAIASMVVSISSSTLYDLGPINHRYLRMSVTPPTTGAVNYTAVDNEKYSVPH